MFLFCVMGDCQEEEEALRRLEKEEQEEEGDEVDEDDAENNKYHDDEEGEALFTKEEEEEQPEPVLNSYGRQALGCMFGVKDMPTMCASYPVANEQSWVDFWYSRHEQEDGEEIVKGITNGPLLRYESENERHRRQVGGLEVLKTEVVLAKATTRKFAVLVALIQVPGASPSSSSWVSREQCVVVKAKGCEGFFDEGQPRTKIGPTGQDPEEQTVEEVRCTLLPTS